MNRDEEHLRLLAILHYVAACITGLISMLPLFDLAMGLFIIFEGNIFKSQRGEPLPVWFGWIFVIMACVFIILGLAIAGLILINGRSIAKRKHYTFWQVLSGVECLLMPFGTVLGVFTLVVLSRDSVRTLFGLSPNAPGEPRV